MSAFIAVTTFGFTRQNLLSQREDSAVSRAFTNAVTVKDGVGPDTDFDKLIGSLPSPEGAEPLIEYKGKWFEKTSDFGENALPRSLRQTVADGMPARMRFNHNNQPFFAVGVPI